MPYHVATSILSRPTGSGWHSPQRSPWIRWTSSSTQSQIAYPKIGGACSQISAALDSRVVQQLKRYLEFCGQFNLAPFPFEQDVLCYFVAFLADHCIGHQTTRCYLSGIRHMQITLDYPDPDCTHMMQLLQQVLCGVRSLLSKGGGESR